MVKWRLFVERWEGGYLGFKVRDVDEGESLLNIIDDQLAQRPIPVRMMISFVGNYITKE
jgi:hypothetical protein